MHSISLIKSGMGLSASSKALKYPDEDTSIKNVVLGMMTSIRSLIVEAQLHIDQFDKYSQNQDLISHLLYKEQLSDKQKELKEKQKGNFLKTLVARIGINVLGRHCYYYFAFNSLEQINRYIPVSLPTYLDSYFILLSERVVEAKQKLAEGGSASSIFPLCYSYIPNQECMAGSIEICIYSNEMDEAEFKRITGLVLDQPIYKNLSEKQVKDYLRIL